MEICWRLGHFPSAGEQNTPPTFTPKTKTGGRFLGQMFLHLLGLGRHKEKCESKKLVEPAVMGLWKERAGAPAFLDLVGQWYLVPSRMLS